MKYLKFKDVSIFNIISLTKNIFVDICLLESEFLPLVHILIKVLLPEVHGQKLHIKPSSVPLHIIETRLYVTFSIDFILKSNKNLDKTFYKCSILYSMARPFSPLANINIIK